MGFRDEKICGIPVSQWIKLVDESYMIGMMGAVFSGWPDGKPLIEQEACVVQIFKIVLSEFIAGIKDAAKE